MDSVTADTVNARVGNFVILNSNWTGGIQSLSPFEAPQVTVNNLFTTIARIQQIQLGNNTVLREVDGELDISSSNGDSTTSFRNLQVSEDARVSNSLRIGPQAIELSQSASDALDVNASLSSQGDVSASRSVAGERLVFGSTTLREESNNAFLDNSLDVGGQVAAKTLLLNDLELGTQSGNFAFGSGIKVDGGVVANSLRVGNFEIGAGGGTTTFDSDITVNGKLTSTSVSVEELVFRADNDTRKLKLADIDKFFTGTDEVRLEDNDGNKGVIGIGSEGFTFDDNIVVDSGSQASVQIGDALLGYTTAPQRRLSFIQKTDSGPKALDIAFGQANATGLNLESTITGTATNGDITGAGSIETNELKATSGDISISSDIALGSNDLNTEGKITSEDLDAGKGSLSVVDEQVVLKNVKDISGTDSAGNKSVKLASTDLDVNGNDVNNVGTLTGDGDNAIGVGSELSLEKDSIKHNITGVSNIETSSISAPTGQELNVGSKVNLDDNDLVTTGHIASNSLNVGDSKSVISANNGEVSLQGVKDIGGTDSAGNKSVKLASTDLDVNGNDVNNVNALTGDGDNAIGVGSELNLEASGQKRDISGVSTLTADAINVSGVFVDVPSDVPSNADIYISNDNLLTYAISTLRSSSRDLEVTFADGTQKVFSTGFNEVLVSGWVNSERQAVFLLRDDVNEKFVVLEVSANGDKDSAEEDYDTGGNNVNDVEKIAFTRGSDNNYYIFFVYTDTNGERLYGWLIYDGLNNIRTKSDNPFSGDVLVAIPSEEGAVALTEGKAYFRAAGDNLVKKSFTDDNSGAITPLAAYVLGEKSYVLGSVEEGGNTVVNIYRLSKPSGDGDISISPLYSLGSYNGQLPNDIAATRQNVFTFSKNGELIALPSEKVFSNTSQRIVVDADELFLTEDQKKLVSSIRLQVPGRGNIVKITEDGYLYRSTTV
jgi:hypothetical protein